MNRYTVFGHGRARRDPVPIQLSVTVRGAKRTPVPVPAARPHRGLLRPPPRETGPSTRRSPALSPEAARAFVRPSPGTSSSRWLSTGATFRISLVSEARRKLFSGCARAVVGCCHQRVNVAELGRFRLQKLAARRVLKKQVANLNAGPLRPRHFLHVAQLAPINFTRVPRSRSVPGFGAIKRETAAIEGNASPRNPSVEISNKSSAVRILLVACRSNASNASSCVIPWPSSTMAHQAFPAALDGDFHTASARIQGVLK